VRRSTVVAVFGGAVTVAAASCYALVDRNVITDKHAAGVALSRVALGAAVVGIVVLLGGLFITRRQRKAEAEIYEDDEVDDEPSDYVWPTIVVRNHGRPRHRPPARIVTVPPAAWPVPSPRHPFLTGHETTPSFPTPAPGERCLPDNVQRFPFHH